MGLMRTSIVSSSLFVVSRLAASRCLSGQMRSLFREMQSIAIDCKTFCLVLFLRQNRPSFPGKREPMLSLQLAGQLMQVVGSQTWHGFPLSRE
jgi:hypothetical protein